MKKFKKISAFLLAVMLLVGITVPANAANSSVVYEGGAEKYVFAPGSEYSPTDLFDNFKGVMPGDVKTETIEVRNNSGDCDYVKIYMKAIPHDENNPLSEKVSESGETIASMTDFLKQLTMTVKNGDKVIYQAKLDELDGLKDYVLLGEFKKGEKTTLDVQLSVPTELGNEYASRVGEVDWVFGAEEINEPVTKTGEDFNFTPWLIAIGVAALVGGVAIAKRKTEK